MELVGSVSATESVDQIGDSLSFLPERLVVSSGESLSLAARSSRRLDLLKFVEGSLCRLDELVRRIDPCEPLERFR